jgi:Ca2+-transporting ATPase
MPHDMTNWHTLTVEQVLQELGVEPARGLSTEAAQRRLAEEGPNELIERGIKSPWTILWEQLTATMVVILIVAAVISALLGDFKDCIAILSIVVLNAILGLVQEYRAEKAMAALKKLAVPSVKVVRDGEVRELPARELVRGDNFLLEAGGLVPVDARLVESINLRVQEAALTGESEAVDKTSGRMTSDDLALGDRRNMVYMGTVAAYGRGRAVVTGTGMRTELGRIATMIQTVEREPTPLQKRMDQLGRKLAVAAFALVVIIFATGLLRGQDLTLMFLTAVSMAVAAIPEGLPAVVTIALALGAQRMLKRHALIRKLPAVEALGSVTVICSDKTGTLTQNRMTVTILDVAGGRIDLVEHLRGAEPMIRPGDARMAPLDDQPALSLLLAAGALCNDAVLKPGREAGAWESIGDPTEGALLVAAARFGMMKNDLDRALPRVAELPFESHRKRMTTVHRIALDDGRAAAGAGAFQSIVRHLGRPEFVAVTKGAVDGLLELSSRLWCDDHIEELGDAWRERVLKANAHLADKGMRVLGVSMRALASPSASDPGGTVERDLVFLGLVAMLDPPRPEVKQAVETCRQAGIHPVMITGDHPLTAMHIARELGIQTGDRILTGTDLERMSMDDLTRVVEEVSVYARVSPEHKLNIVQAFQDRGHIVAMTGDGVNDAPALKKAEIGVAMGITGTDVSKEAGDMVLQDDNFATIVAAVEEGRVIYDNIRKFIRYLLSTNSGELWTMLIAPFLGLPIPLLPLQILWMNLVTDGLPALALGVEPAERHTMRRPPYRPDESVFSRGLGIHVVWVGVLMAALSLGLGIWSFRSSQHQAHFQTIVFTTMVVAQIAHVMAIRSDRESLFTLGVMSNLPMLLAASLTLMLQLALIYVPWLQGIFHTVALTPLELALALVLSSVVFWAVEFEKWIKRRRVARYA